MIKGHGGNIKGLAEKINCPAEDIVDMSSNLNPLGPPQIIETILRENIPDIRSLPDADAGGMTRAFCRYKGISPGRVIAGNGTTWFIYTLPLALKSKRAVVIGPTYSDYKDACGMYGVSCDHYITDPETGFRPDMGILSRKIAGADLVFICNPNNPTGVMIPKEALIPLIRQFSNTVFVVDESYLPFVENAGDVSLISENRFSNLIVLSSMSKIFTIPGLRTGFLTAHDPIVEKVMTFYQPWSVNSLAQRVIRTIFENDYFMEPFYRETHAFLATEKSSFSNSLKQEEGIELFESSTGFILARLKQMKSNTFCEQVGYQKILIRDCANFLGLNDEFVRFSLKTSDLNQRLAWVIKQVLKAC